VSFQYPFLLLALPLLGYFGWRAARRTVSAAERRRFPLLVAAMMLLVVGLSNPYWSMIPEQQLVKAVDVVVLFDVSQSMFCKDGPVRRIDQARNALRNVLPSFAGSSLTVINFAGDAQIACPMTPDLQSGLLFLDSVTAGMTAHPGTRLADLARTLTESQTSAASAPTPASRLVLMMFSDGEFSDDPQTLADAVNRRLHAPVFAFLCGKSRSPVPTFDLSRSFPNAFSTPHPENMRLLATATSGHFWDLNMTSPAAVSREISRQIGEVIREGNLRPGYQPCPFLLSALLLLLLYEIQPAAARLLPGARLPAAACVLLLLISGVAMTPEDTRTTRFRRSLELARQKRYAEALHLLHELQRDGASEEVEIALGNLAYLQGNYDEAIRAYAAAIERNPLNQRARWNWEVALKRKGQQGRQPPPPAAQRPATPPPVSTETDALLKYFDQLEKEQMRQSNPVTSNEQPFAW
jgi:hypothetical protein